MAAALCCCGLIGGFGIEEGAKEDEFIQDVAEIVFDSLGGGRFEEHHEATFAFTHLIDEQAQGSGLGLEAGGGFNSGVGRLVVRLVGQHHAISGCVRHFNYGAYIKHAV